MDKIATRVEALLARMTLAEKVGQLMQLDGSKMPLDETIGRMQAGSLLHLNGTVADEAIRYARETRLGIPVLLADDGIHGHSFWPGATIFPTQLAMACSWNPQLLEEVARVTAREMRLTGLKWTFSPLLCITRDLRWGRVGETFGEDPHLIGELALAMIRGYQGRGLEDPESVLACAKHYAGYSETQGGRDASEADLSRRKLRSWFLPPFERAARNGCMTFMTGYQSMEGVPSTANHWLLTGVLKEEWGFGGIVVTDYDNVGRMVHEQRVCADYAEAAALAVKSGNDMMMQTPQFFEGAQEAVARGLLTEAEIDAPVRRVLALKFRLGLFEDPGFSQPERIQAVMACPAHRQTNLEIARQSLVLLRNEGILPLAPAPRKLAVIGPNADDPLSQLGDWSLGSGQCNLQNSHPRQSTTTILDGLKAMAPAGWTVTHAPGCAIEHEGQDGLPAAARLAAESDLVVLVLGDSLPFIGETHSTATLELQGGQKALVEAVFATGKPVVTVLVNSKPLVLPPKVLGSAALIELFNPGMAGGTALAEVLFGVCNPSGKLPVSIPFHVGQQPVYYNQVRGQHGDRYADLGQDPAFAFGFGLGYTRFELSDLRVVKIAVGRAETCSFTVNLHNRGEREGTEVVQLYIEDLVTSATWVGQELKAFRRVTLAAGQSRTVEFDLPVAELSIVNAAGERVVEPGEFAVHIGTSSRRQDQLTGTFRVTV